MNQLLVDIERELWSKRQTILKTILPLHLSIRCVRIVLASVATKFRILVVAYGPKKNENEVLDNLKFLI